MDDVYIVGMLQTYNELSDNIGGRVYNKHLLQSGINHYTQLCNHLIILDDSSTDGTYEELLQLERKLPNKYTLLKSDFTLHDIGEEHQNKIRLHSYICAYRPELVCDFDIKERYCNNININTFIHIYKLLYSMEMKAVSFKTEQGPTVKLWIHEQPHFVYSDDNETFKPPQTVGDLYIDDINNSYKLPISIKDWNTLYIDIPIYHL